MRESTRGIWLWLSTGFRAAPVLSCLALVTGTIGAVQGPAQAYAVKLLVDGLAEHSSGKLIGAAAIFGGAVVAFFVVNMVSWAIQDTTIDRVYDYVHADLIRLTTGIPSIVHHERPDIADRIELLHRRARQISFNVMNLLSILFMIVSSVTIVVLVATISPVLLLLPVVGLLRVWTGYLDGKLRFGAREATTHHTRLVERLTAIVKNPHHALELRTFGLQQVLLDRMDGMLEVVAKQRVGACMKGMWYELAARVTFGLAFAAAIVYAAEQTRVGAISAGGLALLVVLGARIDQAAGGIASATRDTGESIRLFERYAWLRRYASEQSWRTATDPAPTKLQRGIELRDVEFGYPGSDERVLRDVNLFIPAGSAVALVGENGAGKSTLVKLLARLYDPSSGAVLVDGKDLRTIDPEQWRARASAAFQDFVKFEFTAGGAVGVGDTGRMDQEPVLQSAIVRGNATDVVHGLPEGLDTQLGKRFSNGVDLSGGQWQRLAIARGFMRTNPLLLLLDEPTAALDPEAEHDLYDQFAQASMATSRSTGGITVLVSHRFSTVRMADLIVVLHDGRVSEVGTHAELLAAGGRYAELFELQARAYR